MSGNFSITHLPRPDEAALAHCQRVKDELRLSIEQHGPLALGDYLQFVLHAPGYGYYACGNEKIGPQGDFITAPMVSTRFAECLAQQISPVLQVTSGDLLEIGAGTGQLALSLLQSSKLIDWQGHYYILESSADLACRQANMLKADLPAKVFKRISWLAKLPTNFNGVILANEVVDSMPIEQFVIPKNGSTVAQRAVDCRSGVLCIIEQPAAQPLCNAVEQLQISLGRNLVGEYCSEINLLVEPWLESLSAILHSGLLLLIDYGYPAQEYYLAERDKGTLRCYYRHFMHEDLLLYPGLQDITADVDFSRVARAAIGAGFELHGFTTQAHFLIANGLLDIAESEQPQNDQERFILAQQIHTLSNPAAMGERFQVMGLSKALDITLQGFSGADFSHRL